MKDLFTGVFTSAAGALESVRLGCGMAYVCVTNITTNVKYELITDGVTTKQMSTNGADGVVTQGGTTIVLTEDGFEVAAAALSTDNVVVFTAQRLK